MMHMAVSVQCSRAPLFPHVTTNYALAQGITSLPLWEETGARSFLYKDQKEENLWISEGL